MKLVSKEVFLFYEICYFVVLVFAFQYRHLGSKQEEVLP